CRTRRIRHAACRRRTGWSSASIALHRTLLFAFDQALQVTALLIIIARTVAQRVGPRRRAGQVPQGPCLLGGPFGLLPGPVGRRGPAVAEVARDQLLQERHALLDRRQGTGRGNPDRPFL